MNRYFNFEEEFATDNEIEAIMDGIAKQVIAEDNRVAIVNPDKVRQVLSTYKMLKYITRGTGAKVTYELYSPFKSMGSVTVTGHDIVFSKPEWFIKAIKLSANFEVYPKTNGTVEMNFTFHGLTRPIECD